MLKKNLLSIVVTAHHEGPLVKNTIESLLSAVKEIKKIGMQYELLVNIDKGNMETRACIEQYAKQTEIKIFSTEYGDPGLARNSIIRKTKGEFIAVIDADDVVTPNWFIEAMKRIRAEDGLVLVHPEVEVRFNKEKIFSIDIRKDSQNMYLNTLSLFGDNRWCSIALGRRKAFIKYKYSVSKNGFGFEDYYFNCVTIAGGVKHLVAKRTVAFLLQKEESITAMTHENRFVLPYVNLLVFKRMQKMAEKNGLLKLTQESRLTSIPKYVPEKAEKMTQIQNNIKNLLKESGNYIVSKNGTSEEYLIGTTFCEMIMMKKMQYGRNGVAFVGNLVELLESRKKYGKKILIIVMNEAKNIPDEEGVLNFYGYFDWMYDISKELVLTRIIIQSKTRRIIINKNKMVSRWVEEHKNFLVANGIVVNKI